MHVTNVSSSKRVSDGKIVEDSRPHTTNLTSMDPPDKTGSVNSTSEASAPRKDNSWPLFEYSSELRISTPTLSLISDAVRKNVEERHVRHGKSILHCVCYSSH